MSDGIDRFYRDLFSDDFFVGEESEPYFQEKTVQVIWNEQLLSPDLTTESGQKLQVIHPGVWNVASGPDFHSAVVAVDGAVRRGDVEVHLRPRHWDEHGHDGNRDYDRVVLHVVWDNPEGRETHPGTVPLCAVRHQLAMPLPRLLDRIDLATYPYARKVGPGSCAKRLAHLSDGRLRDLFASYGIARMLARAHRIAEQVQTVGLDTAVYRAIMDALGYKNNRRAFADLAELVTLRDLAENPPETAEAMLFGAAGLLPDITCDPVLDRHREWVKRMWERWWPMRRSYRVLSWNRHRQRPANGPERRVLAAHLLSSRLQFRPGRTLVDALQGDDTPCRCLRALRELLTVEPPLGQERFRDFGADLGRPAALVGASRALDLIVNVAIPAFAADCMLRNDVARCQRAREMLLAVPKLQDNRVFKEAANHFFVPPSRAAAVIDSACTQQGLMQLYREFHLGE